MKKGNLVVFAEISKAEDLQLDYVTTMIPPKKVLLPQRETILKFKFENETPKVEQPAVDGKIVLFGVHPCDINAIKVLDKVLIEGEFKDPYYAQRRENTVIIGLNCIKAGEYCFCTSFGTGPGAKDGFDILLTDLGDRFLVEVGTDAGKKIVGGFKELSKAEDADIAKRDEILKKVAESIKRRIKTENLETLLLEKINDKIWQELADECLACGVCTTVCPTCFCYGVIDRVSADFKEGERIRYWDSCMFLEFAAVALGGNFRPGRDARLKHRMYHKLVYIKQQHGVFGCVGCGRCVEFCVKHIDPVDAVTRLSGD